MQIVDKTSSSCKFCTVSVGEGFRYLGDIYLKVDGKRFIRTSDANCVNLTNNAVGSFSPNTLVEKVNLQLIVTK